MTEERHEAVNHPPHYGGLDNPYEAILVIEAWGCGFHIGNALKYLARAGKKGDEAEDIRKAIWYLERYLEMRREENASKPTFKVGRRLEQHSFNE